MCGFIISMFFTLIIIYSNNSLSNVLVCSHLINIKSLQLFILEEIKVQWFKLKLLKPYGLLQNSISKF